MNLFLMNQKRDRDLDEYLLKLCVDKNDYEIIKKEDSSLLLIGGGYSLQKSLFKTKIAARIMNVDLDPPSDCDGGNILNIKGDFTEVVPYINEFDEIWALYSLPLYAPDKNAIFMFLMNAVLAIKPKGNIRFFPLEFDDSDKMHTKDADYDMTTMECTYYVLNVIEVLKELKILYKSIDISGENNNRVEKTVILTPNCSSSQKEKINSIIIEKIKEYSLTHKLEKNLNVYVDRNE